VAVAAGAVLGGAPTPAVAAPARAHSVGFGIQSATKGKPDARGYLTYSATPGARVNDEAAIVNLGNEPLSLTVYTADATNGTDGGFALQAHATKTHDVGSWITLGGSPTVHVPARTHSGPSYVIVPFRLSIPQDASPGDHAGGVVVSLTTKVKNKQGVQVNLEQRVGLRVYVRVSGDIKPALAIENLHIGYHGPALFGNPFASGTATISYTVHNTGNVLMGATESADVSSWLGGTTHVKGLPIIPPLLPGAKVQLSRIVRGVFPGVHLAATVHLTPVPPSGAADPEMRPVSSSVSTWVVPWVLLALVVMLLGAVGFWFWKRRHPKPRPDPEETVARILARSGGSR
jgi:hypothetical protein